MKWFERRVSIFLINYFVLYYDYIEFNLIITLQAAQLHDEGRISEHLLALSHGLNAFVTCFKGYIINGFRFHTKEHNNKRKTQNSRVVVIAETSSFVSAQDMNPITGDVPY